MYGFGKSEELLNEFMSNTAGDPDFAAGSWVQNIGSRIWVAGLGLLV